MNQAISQFFFIHVQASAGRQRMEAAAGDVPVELSSFLVDASSHLHHLIKFLHQKTKCRLASKCCH